MRRRLDQQLRRHTRRLLAPRRRRALTQRRPESRLVALVSTTARIVSSKQAVSAECQRTASKPGESSRRTPSRFGSTPRDVAPRQVSAKDLTRQAGGYWSRPVTPTSEASANAEARCLSGKSV